MVGNLPSGIELKAAEKSHPPCGTRFRSSALRRGLPSEYGGVRRQGQSPRTSFDLSISTGVCTERTYWVVRRANHVKRHLVRDREALQVRR